jgi:hypothetical protein
MDIPGQLIPIVLFIMIGFTVVGLPIARAFAKRMDRDSALPKVPPEVMQRLERMEHALDSIAIEVERISEGQRFLNKLMAGREWGRAALPSTPSAEHEG